MEIIINSVHFNADKKLLDFVNKKVNKLDTFFDGIISAEITIKVLKPEAARNKISEIKEIDYALAEEATTNNAIHLFKLQSIY